MQSSTSNKLDNEMLSFFTIRKAQIEDGHKEYLSQHPQLRELINDYISNLLLHKPDNVYLFTQQFFSSFNPHPELNKTLVISGPSGVGKGTLIRKLREKYPGKFELSVSYTTRKPRPGEEHGVHYFFVSEGEFKNKIAKNDFIEYCEVHGNYYGTCKSEMKRISENKQICILEIDVQGAKKVVEAEVDSHFLFIYPPNIDTLKQRLSDRGTETEEDFKLRLRNSIKEIEDANSTNLFTHKIINDDLEVAFQELVNLLKSLYPQLDSSQ